MSSRTRPDAATQARESIGDGHVLQWLPPGISDGFWELQPRAAWEEERNAHVPGHYAQVVIEAPADASPERLADLIADQLGYPVRLQAGDQRLRGRLSFFRSHPVYYVFPASR